MTGRYAYHTIGFTVAHCQMFILKKTDLTGFFKIKPRHPDGLKKKHIWVKQTAVVTLLHSITYRKLE